MTFSVVLVALSVLFSFCVCLKIFSSIQFVLKKEKLFEQTIFVNKKNEYILKKSYVLQRIFYDNLQSSSFFFKNLYTKEFNKVCFKTKFLIDRIYRRLLKNVCLFNFDIHFEKLKSCGVLVDKPVFLIKAPKIKEEFLRQTYACEVVSKYVSFSPIFVFDNYDEMFECKNKVVLSEVNPLLFQELCKLNLNYDEKFNCEYKIGSDVECDENVKVERHFFEENLRDVSYMLLSSSNERVSLYLKQNEFYYNVKRIENGIEIVTNEERIKYFSTGKILDFSPINYLGINYLKINLKIKKGKNLFLSTNNFENYKNLCLKERFYLENLFNLKIYIKNNYFNNFFNHDLKKKILVEIYEKNYVKSKKQIPINKNLFCNLLGIEYKKSVENSFSYLDFYNFLVNEVFGIEIKNTKLKVHPKTLQSFKICLNGKSVAVVQNGGETKVDGIVLSNFKFIDLGLVEKNAVINL